MERTLKRTGPPGTWTAGQPLIEIITSFSVVRKVAHGLGRQPDFIQLYLECINPIYAYLPGDRAFLANGYTGDAPGGANYYGYTSWSDPVYIGTSFGPNGLLVMNKDGTSISSVVAGDWRLVMIPYKLN